MDASLIAAFKFSLYQDVTICALRLKGRVVARCERAPGIFEYLVVFWSESTRKDEWLREFEIE